MSDQQTSLDAKPSPKRATPPAPRLVAGVISPVGIAAAAVFTIAFALLARRWLGHQFGYWSWKEAEDWGHAYVVPLVSGFMLWRRREQLRRAPVQPLWSGLAPFLLGLTCFTFFLIYLPNHMLMGASMLLVLFGAALTVMGPQTFRWIATPIAFLALTVTISEMIMIRITFKLQQIAAAGSEVILELCGMILGFDVTREGNIVSIITDETTHAMNVAEACSGMRMVIAFLALAAAVAVLGSRRWWKRLMLIQLSLPVALFMNMIRVAILGLLMLVDPDLSEGDAHTLIGTILLVPSLLLFMGVIWALNKVAPESTVRPDPEKVRSAPVGGAGSRAWLPAAITITSLTAIAAAGNILLVHSLGVHLEKKPVEAPRPLREMAQTSDNWRSLSGDSLVENPEVVQTLGTENYVTRSVVRTTPIDGIQSQSLLFHAAYYTGKIDTVPHVPERCFVGGGLQVGKDPVTLPLDLGAGEPGSRLQLERDLIFLAADQRTPDELKPVELEDGTRGVYWYELPTGGFARVSFDPADLKMRIPTFADSSGSKSFAGYFFIANGGIAPSAEAVRLLAFDRTSEFAYYLKIQFSSDNAESPEQLAELASDYLRENLGELLTSAPDWIELKQTILAEANETDPSSRN